MSSCIEIMRRQTGRDNSSSSSLDGMERSVPREARIESIIELYEDEPLFSGPAISPQPSITFTSSTPSSVYELSKDYAPASPRFCTREELFESEFPCTPSKRISSIVKVPDAYRPRPRLARGVAFHTDTLERRTRPKELCEDCSRASRSERKNEELVSRPTSDTRASSRPNQEIHDYTHRKKQKATDQQPRFDTALLINPDPDPILHYTDLENAPPAMSPRINNTTYPVLVRENRHSSHFSSSSSEIECLNDAPRRLSARARNRLQNPLSSGGTEETFSPESNARSQDLQIPSRQGPLGGPRRGSVQQSISDMYDTLQRLYSILPGSDPKPNQENFASPSPKTKGVPREIRSPAIPMTPYQIYGRKAWEEPKSLSRRTTLFKRSLRPSEPSLPVSILPQTSPKTNASPNRTLARISSRFSLSSRSTPSKPPKSPPVLSTKEKERMARHSSPASTAHEPKRGRSSASRKAMTFHGGAEDEMEHAAWGSVEERRRISGELRKEELKKRIVVMVPLF